MAGELLLALDQGTPSTRAILFDRFGTGTYALILILCLVDVIAGFTVPAAVRRDARLR